MSDPNAALHAARAALDAGSPAAAVGHLVPVVEAFPAHPLVTDLLDRLVALAPDPLAFVHTSGGVGFGLAAVHAFALGKAGRAAEAYPVVRQLAQANPATGIIDWVLPWLDAGALPAATRDEAAALYTLSAFHRFGMRNDLPPDGQAVVRRWLPHVREFVARQPADSPHFTGFAVMLRQSGRTDEAVDLMRARFAAAPTYPNAVSLAGSLRAARRYPEWFDASQAAVRLAPADPATRLDLGDCFWEDQNDLVAAETWYADALRVSPGHEWAEPSLFAVRHLRTRDPVPREALEDYAAAHPGNDRAAVCLDRVTPFFADLLLPGDASTNNLDSVVERVTSEPDPAAVTGTIRLALSGIEPPSCRRAIDRQLELWGGGITVVRDVRGVQSPDPRVPRGPVRFRLWEYDDLVPRPVVAPPPAPIADIVTALACVPYDLGTWNGNAARYGPQLGPAGIPALLGVLAFPPDPPVPPNPADAAFRMVTWRWVPRVQVAAALMLAHVEPGWAGTTGRQVLLDLLNGPMDWTIVAAALGLFVIGSADPTAAAEIGAAFGAAVAGLPRPGQLWYETAILNLHLRLPGLSGAKVAELRAARRAAEHPRTMSDAEIAASMLLARPPNPDVLMDELTRGVIETYLDPDRRARPEFAGIVSKLFELVVPTLKMSAPAGAEGYVTEMLHALDLIRADVCPNPRPTAKNTPTESPE